MESSLNQISSIWRLIGGSVTAPTACVIVQQFLQHPISHCALIHARKKIRRAFGKGVLNTFVAFFKICVT
jgi:hypothetical protein